MEVADEKHSLTPRPEQGAERLMAVTKRVRYEVLRRDNHACRYCGGVAPDVSLTIDHVTPVALGGSDDPSNLVAACRDCNAGKSSVPVDAVLVDDVAQDALRWGQAMRRAFTDQTVNVIKQNALQDMFLTDIWHQWRVTGSDPHEHLPLPSGWRDSLTRWFTLGVTFEIMRDGVRTSMENQRVPNRDKWRYFAGVMWRTVDAAQKRAQAELSQDDEAPDSDEDDDYPAEWARGYSAASRRWMYRDMGTQALEVVCDRPEEIDRYIPIWTAQGGAE